MNNDEMPYGYIIPFFPSSSRFIRTTGSMPFNILKKTLFLPEMKDLVKQYKEVRCIYRKGKKQNMSELYQLGLSPPDTLIEYSLIKTKIGEFMGMNLIKR
jgi:hypothetical protein